MKSSEGINVRFFKEYHQKVLVTSKAASCGSASLIKLNHHTCSLRERTTGAEKVGSRSAFCRASISIENLPMVVSIDKKST